MNTQKWHNRERIFNLLMLVKHRQKSYMEKMTNNLTSGVYIL